MLNPFLTRTRPYPIKLIVDIHSHCNARCTICPYPQLSRQQSQGRMEWTLYESIVKEFSLLGKTYNYKPIMTYCYMGEPFLSNDLPRYVRLAMDHQIEVYLNSNVSAMTPQKIDDLLETGYTGEFFLSFHGITPEVYERISGLDYDQSLENVLYLLNKVDPKRILIRGVDDNWPEGEKRQWTEFWKPKGVRMEYLAPISRCGSVSRLLPKRMRMDSKVRLYGCRCHLPLVEMVILYDGRTVMCCQDMGREIIWGNIDKNGISGVWNGPVRQKMLNKLYSGKLNSKNFLCSRCEEALGMPQLIQSVFQEGWRKIKRVTQKTQAASF